jgi:O-succinylbenzoate synthase
LALTDSAGFTGYGEAAPLPGLHTQTLSAVTDALISALSEGTEAPPVARLAIEGAELMCAAARQGIPPERLLSNSAADTVRFNALIAGSDPVRSAVSAAAAGFEALKIKVGRLSIDEDLRILGAIRARLPEVALRLDANRAWSFEQASGFCTQAARHRIAYIEEPLADPAELSRLHHATRVPLAIDESLLEDRPIPAGLAAVVIKPSVVSLAGARRWAAIARQHGAEAVISGAFESGIARRIHLALAAAVGTDTPISGLSTAAWLDADLLDPPLRPDGDRFVLPGPERGVRLGQLQEVAAG